MIVNHRRRRRLDCGRRVESRQFLEVVAYVERRLISTRWIFGETAADDAIEIAGKVRPQLRDRRWRIFQDRREDRERRVPRNGRLPVAIS